MSDSSDPSHPHEPNGAKRHKPHVDVRSMDIDDLAAVFHLGEELFTAEEYTNLYRTWDEFEVVGLYNSDTETCLVAEMDGRLVGFLLGTTIIKSGSAWKYGYIVWLGVDPTTQRAGVAQRLFNHFRDLMKDMGMRIILVDTQADNLQALRFFRKQGFTNPEEHVFLSLNLDPLKRKKNGKFRNARHYATDQDD